MPIAGEHIIEAVAAAGAETVADRMRIKKVAEPNPDYILPREAVVNWFDREDMQAPVGYFSIRDKIADIKANPQAAVILGKAMAEMQKKTMEKYGDVAKNAQIPEEMRRQMEQMSLEAQLKMAGGAIDPEVVAQLNKALNKIPKSEA